MKPQRCPTCRRLMRRSHPQNSRYWLLLHEVAENVKPRGNVFTAEAWHEYLKQKFIGRDEVKLPNGKTSVITKSSADLNIAEFNAFMEQVEAWAAEHDVYLQDLAA